MQYPTWIVVANASQARIFSKSKGDHQLSLIQELEHPDSRKKATDLVADGKGRYKARDEAMGTFSSRTNPKEVEAMHFAIELAELLEHGRNVNDFKSLVLIAAPPFQKMLKDHISDHLQALITNTIAKDYHAATAKELAELFAHGPIE